MSGIPKRIFYVWGANEKKKPGVISCLLSWKQAMPDYEIIEINEDSIEYFNFQEELKNNTFFREVYKRKMYACVADYIRIKVLYDNGGIYFDTDVFAIKSLNEFLEDPAFVGIQGNSEDTTFDWVEPAILGAQKHNNYLKELLDFYNNKIMNTTHAFLPEIFMLYLKKLYNISKFVTKSKQEIIRLKDITLYPEKFFIPYRLNQDFTFDCIERETVTLHLWNGSWNNGNFRFFHKYKNKLPLALVDLLIVIRSHLPKINLKKLKRKNK